ncbi:MAG: DegV family protein [Clostridia bacterium]|nr:DegV family protein [Clostridia bacterium]
MEKYIISTDMTADIPAKMIEGEKDFHIINMSYVLDGVLYDGSSENPYLSTKDFYAKLAEGKMASTSMVTVEEAKDFFLPFLENGQDVLHLSFSSALSGCYNSYVTAAEELREEYPNNKVVVIDTLCASSGEAILSYYALRRRDEGVSIDDNAEYISNLRHHVGHTFTVDDMTHLYRGGRVSKGKAVVGQALKMKPVLTVSHDGKLVHTDTKMGRKPSLRALVDKMEARLTDEYPNELYIIGNCDAIEDAEVLKEMVLAKHPDANILFADVTPIVGTHLGKGGITLLYLCSDKTPFKSM